MFDHRVVEASTGSSSWLVGALLLAMGGSVARDPPTALAEVRMALDRLGDDGAPIDVATLTVDPFRDTPEMLTDIVRRFSDRGIALRTEDPAVCTRCGRRSR